MPSRKTRRRQGNRKKRRQIELLRMYLRLFFVLVFLGVAFVIIRKTSTERGQYLEDMSQKEEKKNDLEIKVDADIEKTKSEKRRETTLLFTGDVLFSQHVLDNNSTDGIDGILSKDLQQEMQQADITMINQEFPFSTRGSQALDKQYTFRVNPEKVNILQTLGVDMVTLANNHSLDFGIEALKDSFTTLEEAGIQYVGAGESLERAKQLETIEVEGCTIGFLAASRVIPEVSWNVENQIPGVFCTYDSSMLVNEIKESKEECDYTVVYVHWGIEKNNKPEKYQRQLAQEYIDAGADIVIGSHPHVLQGIEYYNGKPIIYSLGNFIFGSSIEKTIALKVIVNSKFESKLIVIPCSATGAYTVKLEDESAQNLYNYLEEISYEIFIDEEGMINRNKQK